MWLTAPIGGASSFPGVDGVSCTFNKKYTRRKKWEFPPMIGGVRIKYPSLHGEVNTPLLLSGGIK